MQKIDSDMSVEPSQRKKTLLQELFSNTHSFPMLNNTQSAVCDPHSAPAEATECDTRRHRTLT